MTYYESGTAKVMTERTCKGEPCVVMWVKPEWRPYGQAFAYSAEQARIVARFYRTRDASREQAIADALDQAALEVELDMSLS